MRVAVISNIIHYHHLAEALAAAGWLSGYFTTACPHQNAKLPHWLPSTWARKLEGRRLNRIPPNTVRRIWAAELLQRSIPLTRLISRDHGDWLNNHVFDWIASHNLPACDVLHFVSSVGLYCARKAKHHGGVIICDVRQEHPFFQRRILEEEYSLFERDAVITGASYERKVLAELDLADYLIVPSQHARRTYVAEGFPESKILTLPYGVDLESFQPSPAPKSKFRVIFAGSLTLRKGPQYLLEAFSQACLPDSELVLVGPVDPAFRPILSRYEGCYRYLPPMARLDLAGLYASSSVFVLPSLADSFSLATLEAMASGLPVIISENTGAADLVRHGRDGFIVPIRNAERIAEHLSELHRDPERSCRMGISARESAAAQTWQEYSRGAVQLYRDHILGTPPRPVTTVAS